MYDTHGCLDLFLHPVCFLGVDLFQSSLCQRVPNSCPPVLQAKLPKLLIPPPSLAAAPENCLWGESGCQNQEGLKHGRALLLEGRASLEEVEAPENRALELVPHLPGDDESSERIFSPRLSSPFSNAHPARSKCKLTGLGYSAEIFICSRLECGSRIPDVRDSHTHPPYPSQPVRSRQPWEFPPRGFRPY